MCAMFKDFAKEKLFPRPGRTKDFVEKNKLSFTRVNQDIPLFQKSTYDDEDDVLVKILYSHGNGEDLYTLTYLKDLIETHLTDIKIEGQKVGFIIWAWEYASYGESEKPFETLSQKTIERDATIVFKQLAKTKFAVKKDCKEITIIIGNSLGCYPSLYLSTKFSTIDACILFSPFGCLKTAIGALGGLAGYWITDKYSNNALIPKSICKVYTIQSKDDEVIKYSTNSRIFKEYSTKYLMLEKKNHNWITTEDGLFLMKTVIFETLDLIL